MFCVGESGQWATSSVVCPSEISSDLVEQRLWPQGYKLLANYELVAKYFFLSSNGNNKESDSVVVLDTLSL